MAQLRPLLDAGYCLRAGQLVLEAKTIIIATGFPVGETFETDGPAGAIALYRALEQRGATCHLACADSLASRLGTDYRVLHLQAFDHDSARREAQSNCAALQPDLIVCIERPGLNADGQYYNMRGEDISPRCAIFDYYLSSAGCPTIAIGDGGNEIGMGKLAAAVGALDIRGAATSCDELLVADVSNWGAYALIAMLDALGGKGLLSAVRHRDTLAYLSSLGSVDGVTRENTLTEDGLPASAGDALLADLAELLHTFRTVPGGDRE
jgi:hypothetical protein